MIENVFALLSKHLRDNYRAACIYRKHRPCVRNVRFASKEINFDIAPPYAQIGKDGKSPTHAQALMNLNERIAAVSIQNLKIAILPVHPGIKFRVALPGRYRKKRQPILRHCPGRHIPIAAMGHHYNNAAPLIDVRLQKIFIVRPIANVTIHPCAIKLRCAHHFNAHLEYILQRPYRHGASLAASHFRKN